MTMARTIPLPRRAAFALALSLALALAAPALPHGGHGGDDHPVHDVPADGAPEITAFRIEKDAVGGFNVFLATENFTFAPEEVNGADVEGHGHAHLYVNGVKLARLYGPALHIPELPFGPLDFRVALNTNNHSEYAILGVPIDARATFTVE